MSNQNRFLLPQTAGGPQGGRGSDSTAAQSSGATAASTSLSAEQENLLSVDDDFDSYWEEEARNPHRNRIRIGRQYQATVPPLLSKQSDGSADRRLEDLETLSFCPNKSAKVSDAELDHYFTVAKSLNLFASLVETRSLLGRDVTIADLNHIRLKEGLSLASVIQPVRQHSSTNNVSPLSNQQSTNIVNNNNSNNTSNPSTYTNLAATQPQQQTSSCSPQKSPANSNPYQRSSSTSPGEQQTTSGQENSFTFNQPLMKALSHFISLHHPCHHDQDCKKLLKDIPLQDDSCPIVSITSGNLRQGSSVSFSASATSKESKPGRSRSSLKQQQQIAVKQEEEDPQNFGDNNVQSPSYEDWTREEVELFSKAIEVCGKNFGSIKKEFLPSKSVKSIVEYYYIGSREVSESKKKSGQSVEMSEGCSSSEKLPTNNNSSQGGGGVGESGKGNSNPSNTTTGSSSSSANASNRTSSSNYHQDKSLSETNDDVNQQTHSKQDQLSSPSKGALSSKHSSRSSDPTDAAAGAKTKPSKNIDARMSVYNFDEFIKEDSPVEIDCPRPGTEVKPLKAKPILPNSSIDSDASNSNVGSLKFFMDGQLVLKLNACQDQQEGADKCHWVQSGDKMVNNASRHKRYSNKNTDKSNGSHSNSAVSSYQDDDSKNDDITGDEDSKESINSFTSMQQQHPQTHQHQQPTSKSNHGSPNPKKHKASNESIPNQQGSLAQQPQHQIQHPQVTSPINYNRLAVNNRFKGRNDNHVHPPGPVINPAMPWLQALNNPANSFAMAAAFLGGLTFPPPPPPPATSNNNTNNATIMMDSSPHGNVVNTTIASKPMDLSLEHSSPKSLQTKSSTRSRSSRPKNN